MAKVKTYTSNALEILDRRIGDDPEMRAMIVQERLNGRIAQMIYDARTKAGLTQRQLAERIATTQSVIARLENADYSGHSLKMLQRIATALDKQVDVRLSPRRKARRTRRRQELQPA